MNPLSMSPVSPRRGFTLIELLTVIAIIGILAAIIIPVAGKVRATAAKASCASNLRQLAHASQTFANDNKDRLPTRDLPNHWGWKQPHNYHDGNLALLLPYLGTAPTTKRENVPTLYCPGPLKTYRGPTFNDGIYSGTNALYITYSYYNLGTINAAVLADYGTTAKDLRYANRIPPRFPLWSCLTYQAGGSYVGHSDPNVSGGFSGQNMVRVDGSVHWIKGDRLVAFTSEGANTFYSAKP